MTVVPGTGEPSGQLEPATSSDAASADDRRPAREAGIESKARARPELDTETLLTYAALSTFGYLLNGLGPVLPFLQADMRVGRSEVAWYPVMFSVAMVVIGLTGERIVRLTGRRRSFWLALGALSGGSLLFVATSSQVSSGVGAAVMGLGGAMIVLLVPAMLSARHGHLAAGAIVEANGLSSGSAILAPLLIAASVAAGVGWRAGFVVLPFVVVLAIAAAGARLPIGEAPAAPPEHTVMTRTAFEPSFRRRWLDLVLVVSVEFCFVLWSTDYMITVVGLDHVAGPVIASMFLVGMAVGRVGGGQFSGRLARPRPVFFAALAVAAAGFALFWTFHVAVVAGLGLLVAGLGVALLYPISLSRALRAWPEAPDRASARCALGSGLAIGTAPFVLAFLADHVGLQIAYLVVPALLAAAAVNGLTVTRQP
jgi:fucose permease